MTGKERVPEPVVFAHSSESGRQLGKGDLGFNVDSTGARNWGEGIIVVSIRDEYDLEPSGQKGFYLDKS